MRKGIIAAGNFIVDNVKIIDVFPSQDSLCNILSQSYSNGGGAYNLLKNSALLDPEIPLWAIGLVGNDQNGQFIINDCVNYHINIEHLKKSDIATSYTDVMTVANDGRRTFFHNRGANAKLEIVNFEFEKSTAKIFYLGYLMLLDELDKFDLNGRSNASYIFEKAQQSGHITISDLVSENSGKFRETVSSSLPFINYLFINEYEAAKITGIETFVNNEIDVYACEKACEFLLDMGVNNWVILHYPAGVIAIAKNKEKIYQPSLNLPKNYIVGSAGAGDAFASGFTVGIHNNLDIAACLQLGVCAAAACLSQSTCSDGLMRTKACLSLIAEFGFRD